MALSCAAGAEARDEFWPELQLFLRLDQKTQVLINAAPTGSQESGERTSGDLGVYLDYRRSDRVSYRAGYVYSRTKPDTPDEPKGIEHRVSLDYSYRWRIGPEGGLLTDRTRLDLRDRDDGRSQRLRNRLQYEWPASLGGLTLAPYANAEIFYDTRYDAFSRYKFELGAGYAFSPKVDVTFYLGRQLDTKPENTHLTALGAILALHY